MLNWKSDTVRPKENEKLRTDCRYALIPPGFFCDNNNTDLWLLLPAETFGARRCHRCHVLYRTDVVGGYAKPFQTHFQCQTQFVGNMIEVIVQTASVPSQRI